MTSKTKGFMCIMVCLMFVSAFSSLHLLQKLYKHRLKFLNEKMQFITTYAQSLSGLRLAQDYINNLQIEYTPTINTNTFLPIELKVIGPLKFKLLKTPTHLYSFAEYGGAYCILKAAYTLENEIVVLLNLSLHKRSIP